MVEIGTGKLASKPIPPLVMRLELRSSKNRYRCDRLLKKEQFSLGLDSFCCC